jgi:hypothetical protein
MNGMLQADNTKINRRICAAILLHAMDIEGIDVSIVFYTLGAHMVGVDS